MTLLNSNIPEFPACGVFISQLIRYARVCSKYEYFLFRGFILVSTLLRREILHENFRLFSENSMVVQNLFSNLTLLCHICWMVCSPTLTNDWFPVILCKAWLVSHMGQEMLFPEHTMSLPLGSSWFHPLSIYTSHILSVYGLCFWINDCIVYLD